MTYKAHDNRREFSDPLSDEDRAWIAADQDKWNKYAVEQFTIVNRLIVADGTVVAIDRSINIEGEAAAVQAEVERIGGGSSALGGGINFKPKIDPDLGW